jgi:hypothetical protein
MTPTPQQLAEVHAQLQLLTKRQWLGTRRCCATTQRGHSCTAPADHDVDGEFLCWAHAKVRMRGAA